MAQSPPASVESQDHFFSGTITLLASDRITVSRPVFGSKPATHTFLITAETRIEGKPKLKAKVTVRFIPDEDGDRAVHIIVRSNSNPKKTS